MNVLYFEAEKYYRLAFDYFHYDNNLNLAQKYVNKALKSDKNHLKALMLKGEILLNKGKIQYALKMFLKAQKLNPNDSLSVFYTAKAYNLAGEYKKGLGVLDKILKKQINNAEFLSDCYELKINILMNLNQYKKAEKILKTLNNKLTSDDIFDLEENFYRMVETKRYFEQNTDNRILHVNF